jgi:hypothetical protein
VEGGSRDTAAGRQVRPCEDEVAFEALGITKVP